MQIQYKYLYETLLEYATVGTTVMTKEAFKLFMDTDYKQTTAKQFQVNVILLSESDNT